MKAEAVREFARTIDLEKIANTWSYGAMGSEASAYDDMHWAAGNAASEVQMMAYKFADRKEQA